MSNVVTSPGAPESNDSCANEPKVDPIHAPRRLLSRVMEHERHGLIVFANNGSAARLLVEIEAYLKAVDA